MAAVKHDYALIAAAVGPYHQFSPDYGNGHPSGANVELAMDMGKYVNSFRWDGDRYGHARSRYSVGRGGPGQRHRRHAELAVIPGPGAAGAMRTATRLFIIMSTAGLRSSV